MDFGGNQNELHNVSRDASQRGFSEGGSASHSKELCFPPSQLDFKIIQNELVISITGFLE